MTGVDVEHTKSQLDDARVVLAPSRASLAIPTMSSYDASMRALRIADALVAAVERVQALHTPINAADYGVRNRGAITQVCTGCGQDDGNWQYWPCPTIRALEIK
ncbi:hypothetical protein ACIQYW_18495 [Rhodococcus erythropolis]|uniref:hypothetical protein n=2 Tax=Rhodococcus baikonurensis TaxID=172041 RepID=UPI00339729CA